MSESEYQGWTNAQTWCVANTFDNTKTLQDKVLDAIRICLNSADRESYLRGLARRYNKDIYKFAPWVWDYSDSHLRWTFDVNWSELREHFEQKINEGA